MNDQPTRTFRSRDDAIAAGPDAHEAFIRYIVELSPGNFTDDFLFLLDRLAQARTEALDVDALAEALHDAMCDVSHHDRPPARCSRWLTYPSIARSVARRYKANR